MVLNQNHVKSDYFVFMYVTYVQLPKSRAFDKTADISISHPIN